ncbi:MAG: hypothetical protein IAG13_13565, partial [Deltaproteobacteria bacterium]|nr:hypothetical protein [Nannocystaceae bacterium]
GPGRPPEGGNASAPPVATAPARIELDIVAFGRVLGTVAPCGCTTEPLGGMQYAFGWLDANTTAGARLVLEPGSFLYPDPKGPFAPPDDAGWKQAESRASLLRERFAQLGADLVSGIGPFDAVAPQGAKALAEHVLPRTSANVVPSAGTIEKHRIIELHDEGASFKVGVTSVLDDSVEGGAALGKVDLPMRSIKREVAAMQEAGTALQIVIAHGPRKFAEQIARDVEGVDIVVIGIVEGVDRQKTGSPPTRMGDTWLLEPGDQLQSLTRIRLSLVPGSTTLPDPTAWKLIPGRADMEKELARVEARLKKFESNPNANADFVQRLVDERARLGDQLAGKLDGDAIAVFEQLKVTCKLPVDDAAKQALASYDRGVAEDNAKRFAGVKPPAPAKGKAGYVGTTACADCHEEAVEFWKTTVHAGAWQTLVDDDKQLDLSCVGCHVTGFRKPGGSEVVENVGLRDVQCEVCHGPGSRHVDDGGSDLKRITLTTSAELCAGECHTAEHSDTFDYVPYLRDVLGKGHGEQARNKLGEGPTGAQLRAAGLAKAGGACKKM